MKTQKHQANTPPLQDHYSIRSKHAYCIIAHNESYVLEKLLHLIDDERNDIFLMIDKKSDLSSFKNLHTSYSHLFLAPRCSIYWGSPSLVKATLNLFQFAHQHGTYSYYHLISGVDLPIKTQDYIHDLLDIQLYGKEFVGVANLDEHHKHSIYQRTNYYHWFDKHFRNSTSVFGNLMGKIRRHSYRFQDKYDIHRRYTCNFYMGPEWVSITNAFVEHLLHAKHAIIKRMRHTLCSDELFIQTELMASPFADNVYDINNEYHSCLRAIDWNRGEPYVWHYTDKQELDTSSALFARKFSSQENRKIIDYIAERYGQ